METATPFLNQVEESNITFNLEHSMFHCNIFLADDNSPNSFRLNKRIADFINLKLRKTLLSCYHNRN